jgi:endonuclease/exonuclease/phosphatase family metal-dependent hydrolase
MNLNWWKFTTAGNPTVLMGDLNDDKAVNSKDYQILQQYLLGQITTFPYANGSLAADLNGDKAINSLDYVLLKQFLLGYITKFPYQA